MDYIGGKDHGLSGPTSMLATADVPVGLCRQRGIMTDLERIGVLAVKVHIARQALQNADRSWDRSSEWHSLRESYHAVAAELGEAIRSYEVAP